MVFDRDVTECSWVAAIGSGDTTAASVRFIRTQRAADTSTVAVFTRNAGDTSFLNRKFQIHLHC